MMKRQFASFIFLVFATTAVSAAQSKPTQIVVTGTASVTVPPDEATVAASVVTTAPRAADAVSENSAAYERVVLAITRTGVARSDISLSYYNVNDVPKPEVPPNPPVYERYGYTVTRSFSIRVRAIAQAGAVIDAATAAGASTIGGVSFGVADPTAARSRATERAVADARAKAQAVARAAGLRITGIERIALDGGFVEPVPVLRMAPMAAAAPTHLEPSNVTITSNISIVFLAIP